jgi:phage terminase small subunit
MATNIPQKKSPDDKALTTKQRLFIDAYMTNGFNATQAAIKAGYSEDTAKEMGYENLTKPHIQSEVKRLMTLFIMPAEEVLSRLTEHARGDLGDIWDEASGQVDWKKARALGKTGLIKKIRHKTSRITRDDGTDVETFEDEIELHNPQTALQLLGKYHETFVDRLKIEITWQDEAISLIKQGAITYEAALETFDHDDRLVRELFAKAQVEVSTGESEAD